MIRRISSDGWALAGVELVVLGALLPWITRVCDRLCTLAYVPGMRSGLEAGGKWVLPLAILALFGLVSGVRVGGSRAYRTAVGGVAVAVAGTTLFQYPPGGAGTRADLGVYVTLAGGLVLLAGAAPVVVRWILDEAPMAPTRRWFDPADR